MTNYKFNEIVSHLIPQLQDHNISVSVRMSYIDYTHQYTIWLRFYRTTLNILTINFDIQPAEINDNVFLEMTMVYNNFATNEYISEDEKRLLKPVIDMFKSNNNKE